MTAPLTPTRTLSDSPTREEVARLWTTLEARGTFRYQRYESGLYPASPCDERSEYTGYRAAWVRDNVHVAYSQHLLGYHHAAVGVARALARHFRGQQRRFLAIIQREADADEPMNRPHIRFDGDTLAELPQRWSHAQNDALGYFVWFVSRLVADGPWSLEDEHIELLDLFPRYFAAVEYWRDRDNGHWEEARKVEGSSIGVVVAALEQLQAMFAQRPAPAQFAGLQPALLEELIARGRAALVEILPSETIEPVAQRRTADAACLFLIEPLRVVEDAVADQIIQRVTSELEGPIGICRYRGDSFWCADYKQKVQEELRTSDWSGQQTSRDSLAVPGLEAQWCIFDSTLSTIFGRRFLRTGDAAARQQQVHYLQRALAQLTPEFLCPELYYIEQGKWQPNDVVPLYWGQANLQLALHTLMLALDASLKPNH